MRREKLIEDWRRKVHTAIERVTKQYVNIGKMTGLPVLGIIVSPDMEENAVREWRIQSNILNGFHFEEIDVLELTTDEVERFGVDNIVNMIEKPMPGAKPESELGNIWLKAITNKMFEIISGWESENKLVIYLTRLGALYPVSTPRALVQHLIESRDSLSIPIILFIPGSLTEPRAYKFLDLVEEFMYRGDLI